MCSSDSERAQLLMTSASGTAVKAYSTPCTSYAASAAAGLTLKIHKTVMAATHKDAACCNKEWDGEDLIKVVHHVTFVGGVITTRRTMSSEEPDRRVAVAVALLTICKRFGCWRMQPGCSVKADAFWILRAYADCYLHDGPTRMHQRCGITAPVFE